MLYLKGVTKALFLCNYFLKRNSASPNLCLPVFLGSVWIQLSNQTNKILKQIITSLHTYRAVYRISNEGLGVIGENTEKLELDDIARYMVFKTNEKIILILKLEIIDNGFRKLAI